MFTGLALLLSMQSPPPVVPVADEKSRIAVGEYNHVPPYQPLIAPLKAEYRAYRDAVLADPTLSPEQKAARVRRKIESIGAQLERDRTAAYAARFARLQISHSCTKSGSDHSGKTKKCPSEDKCVGSEDPNLVTGRSRAAVWRASNKKPSKIPWDAIRAWRAGEWSGTEPKIVEGGRRMCAPDLRKSGKGAIRVRAFGTFVYPASYIRNTVASEVAAILDEIQG